LDRFGHALAISPGITTDSEEKISGASEGPGRGTSKEIVMKRIPTIALLVAASVITAGSAMAQNDAVKATVPFNFTASGNRLPAGTYTISTDTSSPHILRIADREKGVSVVALALSDVGNPRNTNKLVFHRYGNQYFLSAIRCEASAMNIYLPPSKQEKMARTQAQESELRVNNDVLVALK
jgi:hypothetical protein